MCNFLAAPVSTIKTAIADKVTTPLKDFATFADLEAWYDLHKELRMPEGNLCDDIAEESIMIAEIDRKRLSTCLVWDGKVYGTEYYPRDPAKPDEGIYHITTSAIVRSPHGIYLVDLAFGKLEHLTDFIPGGAY